MNLRWAEVVGGRSNPVPLTPEGRSQARRLGRALARSWTGGFDRVYSSPAVRAQQTVRLALGPQTPLTLVDALQEMSQGAAEGQLRRQVYTGAVRARIAVDLLDFALPGGESMNQVADRMLGWMTQIHRAGVGPTEGAGPTVLVGTHGIAVRCVVGRLLGWDHARILRTVVPNASVTVLRFDASGVTVPAFARTVVDGELPHQLLP